MAVRWMKKKYCIPRFLLPDESLGRHGDCIYLSEYLRHLSLHGADSRGPCG